MRFRPTRIIFLRNKKKTTRIDNQQLNKYILCVCVCNCNTHFHYPRCAHEYFTKYGSSSDLNLSNYQQVDISQANISKLRLMCLCIDHVCLLIRLVIDQYFLLKLLYTYMLYLHQDAIYHLVCVCVCVLSAFTHVYRLCICTNIGGV